MIYSRLFGLTILVANSVLAQTPLSTLRGWGVGTFDTAAMLAPIVQVDAGNQMTMVRRADGRVFMRGKKSSDPVQPPVLAPGLFFVKADIGDVSVGIVSDGSLVQWGDYHGPTSIFPLPIIPAGVLPVDVSCGQTFAAVLLSDGTIQAWGNSNGTNVPVLTGGVTYVSVSVGSGHGVALVSDGSARVWGVNNYGQTNIPALPAGVQWVHLRAGFTYTAGMRSDGQLVCWGDNSLGQCNVLPVPAGVTYDEVACGDTHMLAHRSDGLLVGWGDNSVGQCNVPVLPATMDYVQFAAGWIHSVALRSDGEVVAWGDDGAYQGALPPLPSGRTYVDFDCGWFHCVGLLDDGSIQAFGSEGFGLQNVPLPLPPGVTYTGVSAGFSFSVATCSDGTIRAWGDNSHGQLNVPPLPSGMIYESAIAGFQHAVAIRSDGQAITWGNPLGNVLNIPTLPPNMTYEAADADEYVTVLLRSDGVLVSVTSSPYVVIPLPPVGERFVKFAHGDAAIAIGAGILTSGQIMTWGPTLPQPPALPHGVVYVDVAAGDRHVLARCSDGQVVGWGLASSWSPEQVPALDPGTSYLGIDADWRNSSAMVGSESAFVTFASGCSGSQARCQLIPRDTPQIGKTLEVYLDSVPANVAVMAMGWTPIRPGVSLSGVGMPGCSIHTSLDGLMVLVGADGHATWSLAIPYQPVLLGVRFYNQALLLDPGAGNALGAVVSDVAESVVGG